MLILIGLPGTPELLANSSDVNDNRSYQLTWRKPQESSQFPLLYFGIRYRNLENKKKWILLDEVEVVEGQTTYNRALEVLGWRTTYEIEVYAGNILGVGRPAKRTIESKCHCKSV